MGERKQNFSMATSAAAFAFEGMFARDCASAIETLPL
jgi:hypothetical protein